MNSNQNSQIRVRFAPSPTGFLHIGGLRTALFNWLFAHHNKGTFLVRIEDTDRQRFSKEYEHAIIDSLQWAGIESDEPFVYQHARQAEHQKAVDQLLAQGKAYYCFCTLEELQYKRELVQNDKETYIYDKTCRNKNPLKKDLSRPHAVRFKVEVNDDFLYFNDLIRGQVSLPTEHIDDFVIARFDGSMTYNFAVVVDDHFMKISHVIRGEDHIVNTAKQILLYQAFGWQVPVFAHVSLILSPTGQKLSKRDAAVGVQEYKDKGFLADALCNYLVRLGWSHGNQEIFTTEELINYFSIANVGTHGAIFDYTKLLWVNSVYIKAKTAHELAALLYQNIQVSLSKTFPMWSQAQQFLAIDLYKDRSATLLELVEGMKHLYQSPSSYDQQAVSQLVDTQTKNIVIALHELLSENTQELSKESLQNILKTFAAQQGIKFSTLAQIARFALLGSSHGPGVFDMIHLVGVHEFLARLERFLHTL